MPLRDHFRPPVVSLLSWEEFHTIWPAAIVHQLRPILPAGFIATAGVHLGGNFAIDLGAFERNRGDEPNFSQNGGGTAVATAPAVAAPGVVATSDIETDFPAEAESAVRVYDTGRARTLVAAIELVSLANLDRPESREAFVAKCATLLRQGVAVSIIDVVTVRTFNLYAETRAAIGHPDPNVPAAAAPPIYAAACRWLRRGRRGRLESATAPLAVGQPLPTLPLWLGEDITLPLDLEVGYERACYDLSIA